MLLLTTLQERPALFYEMGVMQKLALNEGIASFYDESSGLWESMWGDHMHHGYYPKGARPKSNQQAQADMVDEVLRWAGVSSFNKVCREACQTGCLSS